VVSGKKREKTVVASLYAKESNDVYTYTSIYTWMAASNHITKSGQEPASFTPVRNEADRVMTADVRPSTSRLTRPTHPPTLTPKTLPADDPAVSSGGHPHDAPHPRPPRHPRPRLPGGAAHCRGAAAEERPADWIAHHQLPCCRVDEHRGIPPRLASAWLRGGTEHHY